MIREASAVAQALYGTCFTWLVTALGSAVVFIEPQQISKQQRQTVLDGMLGFSGGVMIAASYWSLLAPAIDMSEKNDFYGASWFHVDLSNGIKKDITLAWFPAVVGFLAGGAFLLLGDGMIARMLHNVEVAEKSEKKFTENNSSIDDSQAAVRSNYNLRHRSKTPKPVATGDKKGGKINDDSLELSAARSGSWRRILLLVFAITLHNMPEGLAVGVGFGSLHTSACNSVKNTVDSDSSCSFESAFNLALGIGLAVSVPLRRQGVGLWTAFFYGQLSGMVEPIAGVIGAYAVQYMEPILPYAMSFAAGAMIFVVVDDLIPEAQKEGNGRTASIGCMIGFVVMMSLDVALG
eukprot:UC4_evm1s989